MHGDERDPSRPPDVHDLELAAGDELVRLRPADPEHRGRLDDRQQQSLALLDLRDMTHRAIHVRSRARKRDALLRSRSPTFRGSTQTCR